MKKNLVRSKFKSRGTSVIMLGYDDTIAGYRLWDHSTNRLFVNRNVIFHENELYKDIYSYIFQSKMKIMKMTMRKTNQTKLKLNQTKINQRRRLIDQNQ